MKRLEVTPGERFGRWTVLHEGPPIRYPSGTFHRTVVIRCECGFEKTQDMYNLRSGDSRGCRGCKRTIKFVVGDRFGFLTVTRLPLSTEPNRVEVKCDCGVVRMLPPSSLQCGSYSSCGCGLRMTGPNAHRWSGHGEINGSLWKNYRKGADSRGIAFHLSIEEAWDLFLKQERRCALTGLPLKFGSYRIYGKDGTTASLDRIDSHGPYVISNVQWIHETLNAMRMDLTVEEFRWWCAIVVAGTPC